MPSSGLIPGISSREMNNTPSGRPFRGPRLSPPAARPAAAPVPWRCVCHPARGLLFLVGTLLLVAGGCRPETAASVSRPAARPSAKTQVTLVEAIDMQQAIEVPGSVEGSESARLMARIEGYLQKVLVDIGDHVAKGQLLAVIDAPELEAEVHRQRQLWEQAQLGIPTREAEVAQAQAALQEQVALHALRESELGRINNLVQGGALTQAKRDEAEFAVKAVAASIERARADVKTAQAHLNSAIAAASVAEAELNKSMQFVSFREIRAPFDGLITRPDVRSWNAHRAQWWSG